MGLEEGLHEQTRQTPTHTVVVTSNSCQWYQESRTAAISNASLTLQDDQSRTIDSWR